MNSQQATPSGLKISPGDIIYSIFRHLKKIVIFAVLGLITGAVIYKVWPTKFQSNAKIMIRFVMENRGIVDTDQDTRVISFGGRGTGYIIEGEQAIILSRDLAREVAETVGAEKLLPDAEETPTVDAAAGQIMKGLSVVNPRGTNMLSISFAHEVPDVARETLQAILDGYQRKHLEIHRKSDTFDDFLTRETDQMRMRLQQTEEELRVVKGQAGIIEVADAKQRLSADITNIRQQILGAKAEQAELTTVLAEQEKRAPAPVETETASDAKKSAENQHSVSEEELSEAMREYATLLQNLEFLRARDQKLSLQYTGENTLVKAVRAKMAQANSQIQALTTKYPELRNTGIAANAENPTAVGQPNPQALSLRENRLRLVALNARLQTLEKQLTELREEQTKVDSIEITVNELMRRKALQESKYRGLLESMERARVQDELGDGRINNIGVVQTPTPPHVARSKRIQVSAGAAAAVGMLGLIWALLKDLLLDRSIKRPTDIQRKLGIPLFMSLPDIKNKRFLKISQKASRQHMLQLGKAKQQSSASKREEYKPKSPTLQAAALSKPEVYGADANANSSTIQAWEDQHVLSEHFEGLRDKVITYFESKNLTHKPKLIGMTGLGKESGVTTIASGLAGSLSKVGEGNVLLVDMTLGHETAQRFYKGKNILNLDEVLESSDEAKMNDNLYVVAEGANGVKLPRIMPQRFNSIMPKLRSSDFDYIIFDLPSVSPISSTPRIASFMDVVLMVVESEETSQDLANQAIELLGDSRAHLGGVLNKTKSRVPRKLEQDLLSQS